MNTANFKFLLALVFPSLLFFFISKAGAENFKQIIIFGDSLSDSGNIYQVSFNSFPPTTAYGGNPKSQPKEFPGRFTNGKIWLDYLATDLSMNPILPRGIALTPKGTNYAYGGAVTGDTPATYTSSLGSKLTGGLPIKKQIDLYMQDISSGFINKPNQDSLLIFWAGSNDILFEKDFSPTQSAINIEDSIKRLIDVGAINILVLNVPSLESIPAVGQQVPSIFATSGSRSYFTKRVNELNKLLNIKITSLQENCPQVTFYQVDIPSIIHKIFVKPSAYGIDNLTQPVIDEKKFFLEKQLVIEHNPLTSFFIDGVHPTTRVHKILANEVFNKIKGNS